MSWLPARRSRPGSQCPVIPNSTEEDQWGTENCGVLQFGGRPYGHRLACRAILASDAEPLVYCVTFAESEPYCHSILFVCLSGCLSVIPRPTAYHD